MNEIYSGRTMIDLQYSVARLNTRLGQLDICTPSAADDAGYYPASSVTVYGENNLKILRDALIAAYPVGEKS